MQINKLGQSYKENKGKEGVVQKLEEVDLWNKQTFTNLDWKKSVRGLSSFLNFRSVIFN